MILKLYFVQGLSVNILDHIFGFYKVIENPFNQLELKHET